MPFKVALAAVVPLLMWLTYAAVVAPGFFFVDDKTVQYSPTFHYIGEQLRQGHFPIIATWQGASGALILDSQYGLLNPLLALQNIAFSLVDNLHLATFAMAAVYLVIFVTGTAAWTWRLSGSARWSAVAGGAAGMSGFTVWVLAVSWHPGLVSTAFLPWMAWSLGAGALTRWRLTAVVVSTYAVLAAGWPWGILAAVVLALAALVEAWRLRGWAMTWPLGLGWLAGALLAAPTQLVTAGALSWTTRPQGIRDTGWGGVTLLDMFNTAQATAPARVTFVHGLIMYSPVLLAGGLSVATLPLLRLRRLRWDMPGVITLAIALPAILVLSQLPSDVGPMRWPFRMLAPWQLLLIVALTLLLARCGVRLSAVRLGASAAILVAFAALSYQRDPLLWRWQVVSVVLAAALMGAIVWLAGSRRALPALGVVLGLIGVIGVFAVNRAPRNLDLVDYPLPSSVSAYLHPLGVQPSGSLVIPTPQKQLNSDVLIGSDYLYGTGRAGWGYSPLGQRFYETRTCPGLGLGMCDEVASLLMSTEPVTGRQWSELMGLSTIVTPDWLRPQLTTDLVGRWDIGPKASGYTTLRRSDAPVLPGRITYSQSGLDRITVLSQSAGRQEFDVADQAGGLVVLADVYWPGYKATFNGEPIEVFALDNSQVALRLPPGAGDLSVSYVPRWSGWALSAFILGVLLFGVLILAAGRLRAPAKEPAATAHDVADVHVG